MSIRAASNYPEPVLEPDRWTSTALPEQAEKTPWFKPEGLEVTSAGPSWPDQRIASCFCKRFRRALAGWPFSTSLALS